MQTGYTISDFEIIRSLGQGSFSQVKLVKRVSDGMLLALKQVRMDKLEVTGKNSALNEIRLLASIYSTYVISYSGSFYSAETSSLYLLMEYAEGGDLQALINQTAKDTKMQRGLPEGFIWKTIGHILQGVKVLHENNIVHRDIKPANIFFNKGIAKLGDLNVSCASESSFYSTKTGTPYYTAPQIWNGDKYTTSCDIWSLGCVVYEMCSLLPPFRAESFPHLFAIISRGEYELISEQYSQDLRTFIRLCLLSNQFDRPTANQLLENPMVGTKLAQFCDIHQDQESRVQLIKPLKCPKVLRFLNSVLPHSISDENKQTSPEKLNRGSAYKSRHDLKSTCSISNRKKGSSSIRVKSCKRPHPSQKSAKVLRVAEEDKTQVGSEEVEIRNKSKPEIKSLTVVRNEKFRLRSCKKIGEAQKQNCRS